MAERNSGHFPHLSGRPQSAVATPPPGPSSSVRNRASASGDSPFSNDPGKDVTALDPRTSGALDRVEEEQRARRAEAERKRALDARRTATARRVLAVGAPVPPVARPAQAPESAPGASSGTRTAVASSASRAAVVLSGDKSAAYPALAPRQSAAPRQNLPFAFEKAKVWTESQLRDWAREIGRDAAWADATFELSPIGYWRLRPAVERLDLSGVAAFRRLPGGFACVRVATNGAARSLVPVELLLARRPGSCGGVEDVSDAYFLGRVDLSCNVEFANFVDRGFQSAPSADFNLAGCGVQLDDFLWMVAESGESVNAQGKFRGLVRGTVDLRTLASEYPAVDLRYRVEAALTDASESVTVRLVRR